MKAALQIKWLLLLCILLGIRSVALADSYSLANSNGGDGYLTGSSSSFQLYGSNNGATENYTTYTTTVTAPETVSFNWSYTTFDCCGSSYDPAGYERNGIYTQLSTDSMVAGTVDSSGLVTLSLAAGDTFGYYVFSQDSVQGRGELAVTPAASSVTPEPGSLWLLSTGVMGVLGWKRTRKYA